MSLTEKSISEEKHAVARVPRDTWNAAGDAVGAAAAASNRRAPSHDLPSSVVEFIRLMGCADATADRELRRQLLLVRDYSVAVNNKVKGKELLSQGGHQLSRRLEATADFNCCLNVIFATSLLFTEETEDVAKDTLRSVITKLRVAQESGDEKQFRAAVVEVVNRILLCTPLQLPTRDASSGARQSHSTQPPPCSSVSPTCRAGSCSKSTRSVEVAPAATISQIVDDCLDFITVEDGVPVFLESRWRPWLNYFESGYFRYVAQLCESTSATSWPVESEAIAADAQDSNGKTAAAPFPVELIPDFATRRSYWCSTTSAYAQFSYILLAIFFVRTKDFSLNYLARVNKLVQYFWYQLESADGEPILVKEAAEMDSSSALISTPAPSNVATPSASQPPPRLDEDTRTAPQDELASATPGQQAVAVQTEQVAAASTPPQAAIQDAHSFSVNEDPCAASSLYQLPRPSFDDSTARRSIQGSRSVHVPGSRSGLDSKPHLIASSSTLRRRGHKCFISEKLPEDLKPSASAEQPPSTMPTPGDVAMELDGPPVRRASHVSFSRLSLLHEAVEEEDGAELDDAVSKSTEVEESNEL